jgi:iron(III) transport system permease protein
VTAAVLPAPEGRGWLLDGLYPLIALLVVAFVAYPLLDLVGRAVIVDGRLSLAPLAAQVGDAHVRQVVVNTFALGVTVAVLGTLLALAYAYAMTRIALPWKPMWHFLALLPTISPPILMALSLILLYGRRGIVTHGLLGLESTALYGFRGLVVAQILSYFPFAYLLLQNLLRNLDASLEEAAGTMGATPARTFRTVMLPLLLPGVASSAVLLASYSFADLGNPLLLGGDFDVLSSLIYQTIIGMYDMPKGAALAVLLLVPAALLFVANKRLARRASHASVGARASLAHLQRDEPWLKAAGLVLVGGVGVVILLQYATVLAGATTRLFGIDDGLTLRHFATALTDSRDALVDTILLAAVAAIVAAAIGTLVAYYAARTSLAGRGALDFLVNLPLSVPGTVIGLGFAAAFSHRPVLLTGTAAIIVIAFVVRSLPYTVRSGVAALGQLHRSLDEASVCMGATAVQTLRRVLLPLVRPAIAAGMIFTFTRSVTTLSAVIFVVSPHWSLVTPAILSQMDRGDVGEAAALSVILVALVLAVIHGTPLLFGRDWRERARQA